MAPAAAASPEATAEAAELARRLWQALDRLNPDERTVLYLRYFLEASEEETSAAIGRPVGTVKSRVHRALRRLREVIEVHYPDLVPWAMTVRESMT
jgi:RNA polymerase sigma-70 factor (ECF subfamily)